MGSDRGGLDKRRPSGHLVYLQHQGLHIGLRDSSSLGLRFSAFIEGPNRSCAYIWEAPLEPESLGLHSRRTTIWRDVRSGRFHVPEARKPNT